MGYSIGVKISSAPVRAKMLAFLREMYRRWDVVSGQESIALDDPTDDLSYIDDPDVIGVDYSSHIHTEEREYAWSLMRWIAIRVGDWERGKPCVIYDSGEERVYVNDNHDELGCPRKYESAPFIEPSLMARIRPEIERLNTEWMKR